MAWENRIVGYGEEKPEQLLANPRNWRIHPQAQQKALKASLDNVGIVDTVKVNQRTGFVVDGHLRIAMAISEEQESIPVTYLDISEEEEKIILASFDPIAAMAAADREQLGELLSGIESDDAAIKEMLETIAKENKIPFGITEGLTDDDDIPEEVEPICKTGDLWELGDHRLLCGDATKKEDVERLMQGEKADMVFTDPPYGKNVDTDFSKMSGNGRKGKKWATVIGDQQDFDPTFLLEIFDYVSEQFWWGADYYCERIPNKNKGSFIVWDKTLGSNGDADYNSEFELLWSRKAHKRQVIHKEWFRFFGLQTQDSKSRMHPTQKPIEVIEPFLNYVNEEAIIVDFFGGSGTTLIACEKLGRKCRMMEIDEHYCDVIIERWQNYTGKEAVKL